MNPSTSTPAPLLAPSGQVLLVHGMGRTPWSWWPAQRVWRQAGWQVSRHGYFAGRGRVEGHVAALQARLTALLSGLSADEPLLLVGHSLGGLLLRQALAAMDCRDPRVCLVLLGSPVRAARLAVRLRHRWLFRMLTGDAGQMLADEARMAQVTAPQVPVLAFEGTLGWRGRGSPFGMESNDGVVAASELRTHWGPALRPVRLPHACLPASTAMAREVLAAWSALRRDAAGGGGVTG